MGNESNINWYPGHMKKTSRMIEDNLRLVDAAVELRDARIPRSSSNPEIDSLIGEKPKIVVLNKTDMADPASTAEWISFLRDGRTIATAMDCKGGAGIDQFYSAARTALHDLIRYREERGQGGRTIRFIVLGIPNVGKSSFINRLARKKTANAEDRPGVTRGKQWITIQNGLQLLDTPGILWPKFESEDVGLALSWTGAINDNILDVEYVASRLLERLRGIDAGILLRRFSLDIQNKETGYDLLEMIGRRRGLLRRGGEVDTERTARIVLDEYRGGKLGRITLEKAEDSADGHI